MTMSDEMKAYVDVVCKECAAAGAPIAMARIPFPYHDGAVIAPLDFETDEFCGAWFVQFGLAFEGKFIVRRLDLGQARFRFSGADDVPHPEGIRPNQAQVRRDDLIDALDQRFGPEHVNTAPTTKIEAEQIWQRIWPCELRPVRGQAPSP